MEAKKVVKVTSKKRKLFFLICSIYIVVIGFILLSLSSCTTQVPEEANPDKIINSFLPNFWVFVSNIIAVFILLLLLIIFAWKPTKRYLEEKNKFIQNEINTAKQNNLIVERLRVEAEKLKIDAYQSADEIIYDARLTAYNQKKEIVELAKKYANEIIMNANREVTHEKQKMREHLEKETAKIIFEVAEQLLSRNITTEDNEKMVNDLIEKING